MSNDYKTERNFILRLKSNTNIVTTGKENAKKALLEQMKTLEDRRQLIVCFYQDSETDSSVRVMGGITGSDTILINDYEITKEITDAIIALKGGVSEDFDTLKKIEDYINSLNFDIACEEHEYIDSITQTNGLVSAVKKELKSDRVTTENIEGSTTTISVNGNTVKEQIAGIAQTIKANENNAEHYKLVELTTDEIGGLINSSNVEKAYKLMMWKNGADESTAIQVGETIRILKDRHLKKVKLVDGQILQFTYVVEDGSDEVVGVDFKSIAFDADFADGLTVDNNGIVKIRINSDSERTSNNPTEDFLTVGTNGIKIAHIKEEIDRRVSNVVNGLDSSASGATKDGANVNNIQVTVTQTDGKISKVEVSDNFSVIDGGEY